MFHMSAFFKSSLCEFSCNATAFHLHVTGACGWLTVPIATTVLMALIASGYLVVSHISCLKSLLQILIEALPFVLE